MTETLFEGFYAFLEHVQPNRHKFMSEKINITKIERK
jgi:hypothetical protein